MERIEHDGFWYDYEHRIARHRKDFCLATKDPKKYCNGYYLYSDKDPGSGKKYIIVATNNPNIKIIK